MQSAQKIYEKNLGTATPLEDDFSQYGDMSDFEGIDADYSDSNYQDKRSKNDSVALFQDQGDPMNFDGQGDGLGGLKQELQNFETTSIGKNPNLSAEEKKEYQTKIEKWIHAIELNLGGTDQIKDEFQTLQQEISTASAYPTSVRNLSKATGVDPSELEPLFKKYRITGDKLPSPPDAKVAALLNDEVFADTLGPLKEGVAAASKGLRDDITQQTKAATEGNDDAKKNNNMERSSNDLPYRILYDEFWHQGDKSKALIQAHQKLATETARLLSSIYGNKVKVEEDPKKAGTVSIDGASFNVVSDSSTGQIKFSKKTTIDWPKVTVVPFGVDNYGGGKTDIPSWMKEANYPLYAYDQYKGPWESAKHEWWNGLLFGVVTGGVSNMIQAMDEGTKKGDDLPTGGELKNIGVQSSGESETTPETDSKTKSETNK